MHTTRIYPVKTDVRPEMELELERINCFYGQWHVLRDISLSVIRGECHVIIGPNGAGKSTLYKCISGELECKSGVLRYRAQTINSWDAARRVRSGMARAFQVARIFRDMTVGENINLALDSSRTWLSDGDVERQTPNVLNARAGYGVEEVLRDVGLTGFRNKSADTLSHGDQKRLELGLCIALQPKLLLLDEPTAGMSPDVRRETISLIRDLMKKYGLTVILTDHDMDVVFSLADNLTVLHQGAVLSTGDPGIVREDSVVKEIYLG